MLKRSDDKHILQKVKLPGPFQISVKQHHPQQGTQQEKHEEQQNHKKNSLWQQNRLKLKNNNEFKQKPMS